MKKIKLLLTSVLLLGSMVAFAQQTAKGVVKDKTTGESLPGVSIMVKGTTNGTSTNFDGNFTLSKVKTGDVLVFTYIGFATKEITLASNFNITVELEESTQRLDEIVVVGYGTTTVKDATGSVEAITAKDFTKGNIVTPENLLSGRVSGVTINQSGAPGATSEIRIRGGSSLSANNSPLIVIDGLPIENTDATVSGSRGFLANINPNDIESFSVLKDASATAIYGSRASNGVIIITTKKGKTGYSLDYDAQYTIGSVDKTINVLSANQFRDLITQRFPGRVSELGTANTNWQDEILRTTLSSIHNFTVRGAIFGMPARLTLGFTNQEGALLTSTFERKNVGISLNPSFFDDHLKINLNYNRAFEDSRFADAEGVIGGALRYDPTQTVYDPTSPFGGFYQHINNGEFQNGTSNPVASLLQRNDTGFAFRQYGNLNIDYKFHFLPELKIVANLGYDKIESENVKVDDFDVPAQSNALFAGVDEFNTQERVNELFDVFFNYKNDFDKFGLDATVGYSYQKFNNSGFNSGNRRNPNNQAADTFEDDPVFNIGFFGRTNLSYNEKYLLTLNYRRDGTSRFSEDNRWGNFFGGAFAWRLSDEDFLKDSKIVSSLKLRVSYGETGQQNVDIASTIYLDRYRFGRNDSQFIFGNTIVNTAFPDVINPNIRWEETNTFEVGVDYGLFDNQITGAISAFRKISNNLIFRETPLPDGTNFSNQVVSNAGEFQIDGLEFSANVTAIDREDMNWNFNINATYLDRTINQLVNGADIPTEGIGGGTGANIQIQREGAAVNSFWVYKQLYDTAGNPIEGAFADLNGDGIINDSDRYLKENPDADVTFGFQSNFTYKNWDFAFNLRASLGNYVYNNVNSVRAQYLQIIDNAVLANLPSSVLQTNFENTADVILSDYYIENASFLRMDNITVGYTFNNLFKSTSTSLRIWAGVQNAFVITNYSGVDPEVFNGVDNTIFPRQRSFLIGTNFKL